MPEFIATVCAGLWAGGCIYISLVEHPAASRVGLAFATKFFRPMSIRAAPLLIVLALIGAMSSGYAWFKGGSIEWLIGALLLLGMFPLTAIFIVPTNRALLKVDYATAPQEATLLLSRWGRWHAIRTFVGSLPFILFVFALTMR